MFPFSFKMIIAVMAGLVAGLGAYTFIYAKGYSYMTNDPKACNNCHIMNEQFDGWAKSSHKKVAACNDCHTPHDFFGNTLRKRLTAIITRTRSPPAIFTSRL
jgi:cytochrome c nitrite reductase small subunit